jgi:hypothetical protein
MKTSELTGPALDWAVMKCEYPNNSVAFFNELRALHPLHASFYYSTDWAQGGPIIDREMLATSRGGSYAENFWMASRGFSDARIYGPTPLIAAMRCYVAFKLGDDVEVPEELTQ